MGRKKQDNRWDDIDGGSAFVVPYTLLRHPNFIRLSAWAHKLLHDLGAQYTGFNNGYLCASWSLMQHVGWNSSATLYLAVRELEHYGIIERTQQGGRNKENLHAFSWRRVDHKKEKPLDAGWGLSPKPTNAWKEKRPDFSRTTGARKSIPETKLRSAA
ncbi:hypothetical protein [Xanthomonas medicagonis]|uniref:hypothetical protein n=1 Tax=Xanthomonas medicagonis TaxID=3160841 RepID=UPI003515460D